MTGTRFGKGIEQLTDLQFAKIVRTLAEPRRIRILQEIAAHGTSMPSACLLRKHQVTAATLSHHAKELHDGGLVEIVRHGRFVHLLLRRDVWQAYVKRLSDLIDGSERRIPKGACHEIGKMRNRTATETRTARSGNTSQETKDKQCQT